MPDAYCLAENAHNIFSTTFPFCRRGGHILRRFWQRARMGRWGGEGGGGERRGGWGGGRGGGGGRWRRIHLVKRNAILALFDVAFCGPFLQRQFYLLTLNSGHWRVCHLYTALLTALTWGGWGEGGLVSVSCSEITLLGKSFRLLGLWILVKHIFVVSARVFSWISL